MMEKSYFINDVEFIFSFWKWLEGKEETDIA
jgi:hypothetical protein